MLGVLLLRLTASAAEILASFRRRPASADLPLLAAPSTSAAARGEPPASGGPTDRSDGYRPLGWLPTDRMVTD